jgi:hypothetical protein
LITDRRDGKNLIAPHHTRAHSFVTVLQSHVIAVRHSTCHPVDMTWRYEFIATRHPHSNCLILDGGKFKATNICDARAVLASVVRNIKVSGPTKPDAIRLIDPKGREVCRAPLETMAPQSGLASPKRDAAR